MYIGATAFLDKRFYQHMSALRRGDKIRYVDRQPVPTLFQQDYDKYGEDSFDLYVLESGVDYLDAPYRERYWVQEYRAADPRYGYNLERTYTQKVKPKISDGRPPMPEG